MSFFPESIFKWDINIYIYLNIIKKPTNMIMYNKKNCAFFFMLITWNNNEWYLKPQISLQDKIFYSIFILILTISVSSLDQKFLLLIK